MKKNGFIATSLIYSFFLIFITLFLTIIADYLQNKVLLNTIEKGIKDEINDSIGIRDFEVGDVLSNSNYLTPNTDTWIVAKIEIDNNTIDGDDSLIYLYSYELFDSVTEDENTLKLTQILVENDLKYGGVFNNTYLNKVLYIFDGDSYNLAEYEIKKDSVCLSINDDLTMLNNCNVATSVKYRIRKKIPIGNKRYTKEIAPDNSITITGEI